MALDEQQQQKQQQRIDNQVILDRINDIKTDVGELKSDFRYHSIQTSAGLTKHGEDIAVLKNQMTTRTGIGLVIGVISTVIAIVTGKPVVGGG